MRTVTGRVHITTGRVDSNGGAGNETHDVPTAATYEDLAALLSTLESIGDTHDVLVQAFDARYIAGEAHLRAALEHAKRSMAREENVADDLAVEVLLYAAGRRQIDDAMELGLDSGTHSVIVLLDGASEAAAGAAIEEHIDPGPVEPDESKITEYFDISAAERAATTADLSALVQERVALLDVEK